MGRERCMKNALVLVAVLFLLAACSSPQGGDGTTQPRVEEATLTPVLKGEALYGEEVVVEVKVSSEEPVYGYLFNVAFDQSKLDFESAEEGTFLAKGGQTFVVSPEAKPGRVAKVGAVLLGKSSGVSGEGVVAKLTFKAKGKGETVLRIEKAELVSPGSRKIPVKVEELSFNVK